VAALNLFVRSADGDWLLVAHHASPVSDSAET
jgi:ketosteroid isomerase-like protein